MPVPDLVPALGITATPDGGELRVWSHNATAMELCLFSVRDANGLEATVPMQLESPGVWLARSPALVPGAHYAVRTMGPTGPTHAFNPERMLLDPYSRGLARSRTGEWRSYVQDDSFDWGTSEKPRIPLDRTVIYEAHVRGISRLNPEVPEELRGTYAGLAHPSTIAYLKNLGVTTIELLPVHQSVSEQRLIKQGLVNYWGYNTLNFFSVHAGYATRTSQRAGAGAVLREFKGMVKLLHEAGLEVVLDVVYNHTAEEGRGGPTTSLRGLDNASYYRQMDNGDYIDVTGCGNTVNFSQPAAQQLVLDSLRYWARDMQIDGFRFDLAVTLGRDDKVRYDPEHPLLTAIVSDPDLADTKMIAEPWDVGMGGWQVGNFPHGFHEWNDGYRDRAREFWLTDVAEARRSGRAPQGIGGFARRLAGSSHNFSAARGPLASVNFITAHDGFTMADLTAYDQKHNLGNGENNRDGTDNNRSYNFGVEGPTRSEEVLRDRRRAIRNMLGTLLLSSGIPMMTAGDEFGRTQRGNNNAYCHDGELTWLAWSQREPWQRDLEETTATLLRLRRENPALRPTRFGRAGQIVPSATQMDWYNVEGVAMNDEDWNDPSQRTLQYLAASTPEFEEFNRILLIVHGLPQSVTVTLPEHEGVTGYSLLWDSSRDGGDTPAVEHSPGGAVTIAGTSMMLLRAHGAQVTTAAPAE
ncbi:MAG: glycogen debranching protein GlgX [Glaciihabitans sp.]